MAEENPEEVKPQEPKEEKKEEKKEPQQSRMVEDAHLAAARLKEQNEIMSKNLDRQEALAAQNALGGGSQAGQEPAKPKEEKPTDYVEKVMKNEIELKNE